MFKRNYNVQGSLNIFHARLVVKGYGQNKGINYFDKYALVDRITSIRIWFLLASVYDFHIHQINVKTTFTNGDLDDEVYTIGKVCSIW